MNAQTIISPTGERLIVLAEADYNRLVAAAEDAADIASVEIFRRKLAAGEEELVPAEIADRILNGENRIRVWREHRGLTSSALASKAGIAQGFLSQIETGRREGTVETLRKIADALSLMIDDLVG
ncbi:MAG: helix-turn-helix domain-containing protein [Methylocella sp.]